MIYCMSIFVSNGVLRCIEIVTYVQIETHAYI